MWVLMVGWEKNEAISAAIAKGEAELGSEGRILVRPSGTEPLIRVMAEGPDQAQLDRICNEIADVVKKEQGWYEKSHFICQLWCD